MITYSIFIWLFLLLYLICYQTFFLICFCNLDLLPLNNKNWDLNFIIEWIFVSSIMLREAFHLVHVNTIYYESSLLMYLWFLIVFVCFLKSLHLPGSCNFQDGEDKMTLILIQLIKAFLNFHRTYIQGWISLNKGNQSWGMQSNRATNHHFYHNLQLAILHVIFTINFLDQQQNLNKNKMIQKG